MINFSPSLSFSVVLYAVDTLKTFLDCVFSRVSILRSLFDYSFDINYTLCTQTALWHCEHWMVLASFRFKLRFVRILSFSLAVRFALCVYYVCDSM